MSILLVGGYGSIGRRYAAILRRLNVKYKVADVSIGGRSEEDILALDLCEFDRAIVATPTATHYEYCKQLIKLEKPFLCEKPLSKNLDECTKLVMSGFLSHVVNNYYFAVKPYSKRVKGLAYNYYNTGKDGTYWDLCQLIHLDNRVDIQTESPIFRLSTGDVEVPHGAVEHSYVRMLEAWLNRDTEDLWTLRDGLEMTHAVLERMKRDKCES